MICLALPAGFGCGGASPFEPTQGLALDATRCGAGQAQIAVRDGAIQSLCGCAESTGQLVGSNTGSLTCTVPAGTVVFFHYVAPLLPHQIVSTGTPSFPSSALSGSGAIVPVPTHAVRFESSGTYAFQDAFDNGLRGQITVQ